MTYPYSAPSNVIDGVDDLTATLWNTVVVAPLNDLLALLGDDPAGTAGSIEARLGAEHNDDGTHSTITATAVNVTGNISVSGNITVGGTAGADVIGLGETPDANIGIKMRVANSSVAMRVNTTGAGYYAVMDVNNDVTNVFDLIVAVAAAEFHILQVQSSVTYVRSSGGANGSTSFEMSDNVVLNQSFSGNNNVPNIITFTRSTGSTPIDGFGQRTLYQLDTSTTDYQDAAAFDVIETTADHATFTTRIAWLLRNSGAALAEYMRLTPAEFTVGTSGVGLVTFRNGAAVGNVMAILAETRPLAGAAADSYAATLSIAPTYTHGSGVTLTRHSYINIPRPVLTNVTLTDAAVFRFTAAAGTHEAVDAGTTKSSPGTVNAWVKINISGVIYYLPAYTSKTS